MDNITVVSSKHTITADTLASPAPSKFSWASIKDYYRVFIGRHIVADYPYDDQGSM